MRRSARGQLPSVAASRHDRASYRSTRLPRRIIRRVRRGAVLLVIVGVAASLLFALLVQRFSSSASWSALSRTSPRPQTQFQSQYERAATHDVTFSPAQIEGYAALAADYDCLDSWINEGRLCSSIDLKPHSKISAVWTWANGSDPTHQRIRKERWIQFAYELDPILQSADDEVVEGDEGERVEGSIRHYGNTESRFEDNEELLYSMRSVIQNLGSDLDSAHILTPDVEASGQHCDQDSFTSPFVTREGKTRCGQLPTWFDTQHENAHSNVSSAITPPKQSGASVYIHHNWNSFQAAQPNITATHDETWMKKNLPSFNSIAIEATMGHEAGVTETYFYSNDDMYLGAPVSTADLWSPLFGPNLMLTRYAAVQSNKEASILLGYAAQLERSNGFLSERFGVRDRFFVSHTQKVVVQPLMDEMKSMFVEEITRNLRPFRAVAPDISIWFLLYHFIIERHREALLWSFFVAKSDVDGDGRYSREERQAMLSLLGVVDASHDGPMPVYYPADRHEWDEEQASAQLESAHFPRMSPSSYMRWTSLDGYGTGAYSTHDEYAWPTFANKSKGNVQACELSEACVDVLLDRGPEDAFKMLSFQRPLCGDCVIMQLIKSSGQRGLEAFLPARNRVMPGQKTHSGTTTPPYLPLVGHWRQGAFSLADVAQATESEGADRRLFVLRLLQRYQYTLGWIPRQLFRITDESDAETVVDVLAGDDRPAFICINDEIADTKAEVRQETYRPIRKTLQALFPLPLPFERRVGF